MNPSEEPPKSSETHSLKLTPELRDAASAVVQASGAFDWDDMHEAGADTFHLFFDTAEGAQKADELLHELVLTDHGQNREFINSWHQSLDRILIPFRKSLESCLAAGRPNESPGQNEVAPSPNADGEKVLREALTNVKTLIERMETLASNVKTKAVPVGDILESWRGLNEVIQAHSSNYEAALAALSKPGAQLQKELDKLKREYSHWVWPEPLGSLKEGQLLWPFNKFANGIPALCATIAVGNIEREKVPISHLCWRELDAYQKLFNCCGLRHVALSCNRETSRYTDDDAKRQTDPFVQALQRFVSTATRAPKDEPAATGSETTAGEHSAGQSAQENAAAPVQKPPVPEMPSQPSLVHAIVPDKLNREESVRPRGSAPGEKTTESRIHEKSTEEVPSPPVGEASLGKPEEDAPSPTNVKKNKQEVDQTLGPAVLPPYRLDYLINCIRGSGKPTTRELPRQFLEVLKEMLSEDPVAKGSVKGVLNYEALEKVFKDGGYTPRTGKKPKKPTGGKTTPSKQKSKRKTKNHLTRSQLAAQEFKRSFARWLTKYRIPVEDVIRHDPVLGGYGLGNKWDAQEPRMNHSEASLASWDPHKLDHIKDVSKGTKKDTSTPEI